MDTKNSIEMEEIQHKYKAAVEYKDYQKMLELFIGFLEKCHRKKNITFAHVVFVGGTVVRLDNDQKVFNGDFSQYIHEFPTHRFKTKADTERAMDGCFKNWELMNEKLHGEDIVLASRAFNSLIKDGYPLPGGENADRESFELDTGINITYFQNCDHWIFNITTDITPEQANYVAADLRRYDYIIPTIRSIIKPPKSDGKFVVVDLSSEIETW